jgi:pSer/pThr/pTyr-binding forkhead associated (FHA) protein
MEPYIVVTNQDGWRKEFLLESNLIYIGSALDNDIVLAMEQGRGVSPRHIQLIAMPGGYRAVNLGETNILTGDQELEPRFAVDVADGTEFRVGDFGIIFHFDEVIGTSSVTSTKAIGVGIALPRPVILIPEQPVEGSVLVRNAGTESGVQFMIQVEGLEETDYEIGPGPILFPNAEKAVFLRLHHPRRPTPPAGAHRIRIRASAPEAYPGQSAVESLEVEIRPYHQHTLHLLGEEQES